MSDLDPVPAGAPRESSRTPVVPGAASSAINHPVVADAAEEKTGERVSGSVTWGSGAVAGVVLPHLFTPSPHCLLEILGHNPKVRTLVRVGVAWTVYRRFRVSGSFFHFFRPKVQ